MNLSECKSYKSNFSELATLSFMILTPIRVPWFSTSEFNFLASIYRTIHTLGTNFNKTILFHRATIVSSRQTLKMYLTRYYRTKVHTFSLFYHVIFLFVMFKLPAIFPRHFIFVWPTLSARNSSIKTSLCSCWWIANFYWNVYKIRWFGQNFRFCAYDRL